MEPINNVVAITPVWNESLGVIQEFHNDIEAVRRSLNSQGTGFQHFFLDDAAINLPDSGFPILVRHEKNERLARTLIDGYRGVLGLKSQPDLVVRLDCNEHRPEKILEAVELMSRSPVDALFLPVWYWIEGESQPLMREITGLLADFTRALSPIKSEIVLGTYNQRFPLGFQAFRVSMLERLFSNLDGGMRVYEEIAGKPASWGLDLLAILLAAREAPEKIDFLFGGWSTPWRENRGSDKVAAQREKARVMVEVAKRLGCHVIP